MKTFSPKCFFCNKECVYYVISKKPNDDFESWGFCKYHYDNNDWVLNTVKYRAEIYKVFINFDDYKVFYNKTKKMKILI